MNKNKNVTSVNGPPDTAQVRAACLCEKVVGREGLGVRASRCRRARSGGRGGARRSTREALSGAEARGSPEGTARLEEPLAG